jgi:2,4-dienoyl-CoA reductase-like NADH-dependent reductase (Old Yellow Enzyme family)
MSASESPYPKLFSPITIRGTTIRNRLVQSAHSRSYSDAGELA